MKKIIIALLAISTMIAFAETVRPIDSASTVSDISTASSLDTSVRTDTPAENIQIPLDTVFDEDFPLMRDQESSGFMSELSTPQGIFGIIIVGMIYIIVPLLFYIISSWSMARIDGFYNRFSKKWVFWIPFFRMYTLIKNATKSGKKAFFLALFPWVLILGGVIVMALFAALSAMGIDTADQIWSTPLAIIGGASSIIGLISLFVMNFWKAFVIKNYVKGDTTTALGLSTYTALVLWYIALDRTTGKTDVIGKTGFAFLILVALAYIGFAAYMLLGVVGRGFGA